MAPSLTETVSLSAPTLQVSKTDAGHNKESLTGYKIETEAEISGTTEQPPASFPNYLPVWDNESERYDYRADTGLYSIIRRTGNGINIPLSSRSNTVNMARTPISRSRIC